MISWLAVQQCQWSLVPGDQRRLAVYHPCLRKHASFSSTVLLSNSIWPLLKKLSGWRNWLYNQGYMCCARGGLELYPWLCHILLVHCKQAMTFSDMATNLISLIFLTAGAWLFQNIVPSDMVLAGSEWGRQKSPLKHLGQAWEGLKDASRFKIGYTWSSFCRLRAGTPAELQENTGKGTTSVEWCLLFWLPSHFCTYQWRFLAEILCLSYE